MFFTGERYKKHVNTDATWDRPWLSSCAAFRPAQEGNNTGLLQMILFELAFYGPVNTNTVKVMWTDYLLMCLKIAG